MIRARRVRRCAFPSLLALAALAGCGGSARSHDYANTIAKDIQTGGTQQIRRVTNSAGRSGNAHIDKARCVRSAGRQEYSCVVDYTYQNSEGTYDYEVRASGTCGSGGRCRWHLDGAGTLVAAEPD